eukprot:c4725_g1_i1.p1 GENE.c4725_g1_i1~~c4725_g1_i1.p1  ORF type:complete len:515 (-),score=144.80 c4725_g1_i1:131-1675(-)
MGNSEGRPSDDNDDVNEAAQQPHGTQGGEQQLSYWEMFKQGKEALVHAIIRPPRAEYDIQELGPSKFMFSGVNFQREDLTLKNPRGQSLACSWWQPEASRRKSPQLPVIIYMHGNASCRVECLSTLCVCLSTGATVFAFDFSGCGMSEGEYISLGYFERDDLATVVSHLRESNSVSTIALWGRSMGAATALLHGHRDPSIAGMILDSPFADLTQLARELVEHARGEGMNVPSLLVTAALKYMGSQVKSKAGFDIKELRPEAEVDKCFIPALFAHGQDDDFIRPHHSTQIHDRYAGDKNMITFEGDHSSERPKFFFNSVGIFLQNCLHITPNIELEPALGAPESPSLPWDNFSAMMAQQRRVFADVDPEEELIRRALEESLSISCPATTDSHREQTAHHDHHTYAHAQVRTAVVPNSNLREQLVGMGFEASQANEALVMARNNVEIALELLLTGGVSGNAHNSTTAQPQPQQQSQSHSTNSAQRLEQGVVRLQDTLLEGGVPKQDVQKRNPDDWM